MAILDDLILAVGGLQDSVDNLTLSVNVRKTNLDNAISLTEQARDQAIAAEVNLQQTSEIIIELSKEKEFDSVGNVLYCGVAPYQSIIDQNVWTITKITINIDGTTISTIASNVAWTDRLTAIYN